MSAVIRTILTLSIGVALVGLPASLQASNSRPRNVRPSSQRRAVRPHKAAQIDLNTASAQQLESLPGIGPSLASAIIKARPFSELEDLKKVRGIGDAKFRQISPLVEVKPGPVRRAASPVSSNLARRPLNSAPGSESASGKVNINTATKEQLQGLPGIGASKAQAIIDHRPYKTAQELMKIKGIKEGTFNRLKDKVVVQ